MSSDGANAKPDTEAKTAVKELVHCFAVATGTIRTVNVFAIQVGKARNAVSATTSVKWLIVQGEDGALKVSANASRDTLESFANKLIVRTPLVLITDFAWMALASARKAGKARIALL